MPRTSGPWLGAVLLAGGASVRFGPDNKLLATVGDRPMIAHVAGALAAGGVGELVVVTGAEHARYIEALSGLAKRFVHNCDWSDGIGSSIAAGVRELSGACEAAFIVPGDLPNLTAEVVERLREVFRGDGGARVAVPVTADGEQRNPVLWPRRFFPLLAALTGPQGGKALLGSLGDDRLDVVFEVASVFTDIDTQSDLACFRKSGTRFSDRKHDEPET